MEKLRKIESREEHSRKHHILDVAERMMLRQGYAATSMGDICKAVGVTKGALFHHFSSKEEMGRLVLARWIEKTLAPCAFALDPHIEGEPLRRLRHLFDTLVGRYEVFSSRGCLLGMFAMEQGLAHPAFSVQCAEAFSKLGNSIERELTRAAAACGGSCTPDPSAYAALCVAAIQGALLVERVSDSDAGLRTVLETLLQGIEASFS